MSVSDNSIHSQRHLTELQLLMRVLSALNDHTLDLEHISSSGLMRVCEALASDSGAILLLNSDAPIIRVAHATGLPDALMQQLSALTPSDDPVQYVRDTLARHLPDAHALIPLYARSNLVGLMVLTLNQPHLLTPPSIDLLMSIGENMGMAIENARLHNKLLASEAWHREFIEQTPDAIFESDFQERIHFVNQSTCALLGYTQAEMLEKTVSFFEADTEPYRKQARRKLRDAGSLTNTLARLRAKDGTIKTVRFSSHVVKDQQGNPIRFQTIMRDVTDQEHLIETLERRRQELATLNAIGGILSDPLRVDHALDQVCEQIVSIIGMETIAITLHDERQEFLNLVAYRGISENLLPQVRHLGLDDALTRSVAVDGQVIAVSDIVQYVGEGFAGPRQEGYHAGICAPILKRGVPSGAIFLGSKIITGYAPSDVDWLASVGKQVGAALENVELFNRMKAHMRELDGLANLSAALVTVETQDDIWNHTIACMRELFDADIYNVRTIVGNMLHLCAVYYHQDGMQLEEDIAINQHLQFMIDQKKPFVIDNLIPADQTQAPIYQGIAARGLGALMAVPLYQNDRFVGALNLLCLRPYNWTPRQQDLLQTIARQVGVALEKAAWYEQTQQHVRELEGLAQLSWACTRNLDLQTIFDSALYWTRTLLNSDAADLRKLNGKRVEPVPNGTLGMSLDFNVPIELNELAVLFNEKRAELILNDAQTDPQVPAPARQIFEQRGIRAVLATPLFAQGRVIGILSAIQRTPRQWTPREIDLLGTIANQTANAMGNAELFQNVLNEQRQVKAIFDSALNGLYMTDAQGRITMFNHTAAQMTGWQVSQAIGKKWDEIFASAEKQTGESLVAQAVDLRGEVYSTPSRNIRRRDGKSIPVAEAAAPIFDEHQNITSIVGAFWDLTREKQAEIERERFLSMFTHQLSTPLTTLLNAGALLEQNKLPKPRRDEMIAIVRSETHRLQRFARQFLEMRGAFATRPPVVWQAVELFSLVEQVVQRFRADSRKHQFRIKSPNPTPRAFADRDRVEHVLSNLLDNAVNYSPDGTRIAVTLKQDTEFVQISIQDHGPGVSESEQELIFERFYRSQDLASGRVYGHGLGLSIAREMVLEMGGSIWVESTKGHGATFRFTLRSET
jgi:PAS domain S-box-containing protein